MTHTNQEAEQWKEQFNKAFEDAYEKDKFIVTKRLGAEEVYQNMHPELIKAFVINHFTKALESLSSQGYNEARSALAKEIDEMMGNNV